MTPIKCKLACMIKRRGDVVVDAQFQLRDENDVPLMEFPPFAFPGEGEVVLDQVWVVLQLAKMGEMKLQILLDPDEMQQTGVTF